MNGLFNTLASAPQYNGVTFLDLYPTVRGMSPWERTKLIDEFLHDASGTAFRLECDYRRFVDSCTGEPDDGNQ